jgi:hypothetical protein
MPVLTIKYSLGEKEERMYYYYMSLKALLAVAIVFGASLASKFFHPSHRIFRHMHGTLNVDKKMN